MVKLVGIAGSLRPGSYSHQALAVAAQRAEALGAEVEILDLRSLHLPFCDGSDEYPTYPDVAKLRQTVKQADGLILATPEYHGSVSGVLKNTLDLMGFEHLAGKVTGAISVLGGQPNSNALKRSTDDHALGTCLDNSRAGGDRASLESLWRRRQAARRNAVQTIRCICAQLGRKYAQASRRSIGKSFYSSAVKSFWTRSLTESAWDGNPSAVAKVSIAVATCRSAVGEY